MNNPLLILQTLDRNLTAFAEMTLFGRAALALGYPDCPAEFAATHDFDAILPLSWLAAEAGQTKTLAGLNRRIGHAMCNSQQDSILEHYSQ